MPILELHDDVVATTGPSGVLSSSGVLYDPFGGPLDRVTGLSNLAAVPSTRTNGLTDVWEGQHQRAYEHTGGLNDTLMGVRLYLPAWGQFTSVDPVFGGNPNPYMYPSDPINGSDLTGEWGWSNVSRFVRKHARQIIETAVVIVAVAAICGTGIGCGLLIGAGLGFATGEGNFLYDHRKDKNKKAVALGSLRVGVVGAVTGTASRAGGYKFTGGRGWWGYAKALFYRGKH